MVILQSIINFKMCHKIFVVFLIALVGTQFSEAAAVSVTKCKSSDAKCIKASALAVLPAFLAGIPEMNVAPLDPLHIDSMDASSSDLKLLLNDITVTGLKSCDIKKLERDAPNSKLLVTVLCDVDVRGKYEISGRILVIPIEGKGNAVVQLNKILLDFEANLVDKTDKQGVKHWDIKSFSHSFDLKDQAKIHLDNLFNGNKELSAAVNNLFDTSANEVVKEVGVPIVKGIVTSVVKNVNHFFHRQAIEDLSID